MAILQDTLSRAEEPEPNHFVGTMAEQLLQVIAGIWTEHPDYSLRQTLEALNALMLPAEPVQESSQMVRDFPAVQAAKKVAEAELGYYRKMTAEPVQAPDRGWLEAAVAWEVCGSIHATFAKGKDALFKTRHADFVKHAEDARAKAKLYAAPQQRKPLTDEQIDAAHKTEKLAVIALMHKDTSAENFRKALRLLARAVEAAHNIGEAA